MSSSGDVYIGDGKKSKKSDKSGKSKKKEGHRYNAGYTYIWYCCNNHGPMTTDINSACPECNHVRCGNCRVERHRQSSAALDHHHEQYDQHEQYQEYPQHQEYQQYQEYPEYPQYQE